MRKQFFYTALTYCIISLFVTTFGHEFPFPEDVNADGIVNVQDLVLVASAFENGADPSTSA